MKATAPQPPPSKSTVVKKTVSLAADVAAKAEEGAERQRRERSLPAANLSAYIASLIMRDAEQLAGRQS